MVLGNRRLFRFDLVLLLLMVTNVAVVMAETEEALFARYQENFEQFETRSVAVFTLGYLFRL